MTDTRTSAPEEQGSAAASSTFRADLDGLRAIAVVLVVLYHARVPGWDGGFVGVDVFFVISGYLITRNLLTERAAEGRVGLMAFWGRRLRRLTPALGLVIVVTLLVALAVLAPLEWATAADDATWSATYLSNVAFARRATDYFADGTPSLFLHTWSLAVEEQFYVVWPLLVAGVMARRAPWATQARRVLTLTFAVVALGSFALGVALTRRGTPWAFYGLPTRAWQFAAAGLLALGVAGRGAPRARVAAGWIGLGLLALAVLRFDALTPYPGTAAAVPTVGALLLVGSGGPGRHGLLDTVLAHPAAQALGRVSYSWYLWHWPVLLLAIAATGRDRLDLRLGAMVVALGLGAASLRLLEDPVRRHPRLVASPRRSLAAGLAFVLVGVAAAAGLGALAHHRLGQPFDARLHAADRDQGYRADCRSEPELAGACVLGPAAEAAGAGATTRTVVVVGDSHAEAWIPALAVAADRVPLRIVVRARGGCPGPEIDVAVAGTRDSSAGCRSFRRQTAEQLDRLQPDLVVITSASYLGRVLTGPGHVGSQEEQLAVWRRAFEDHLATVTRLHTRAATILGGPQLAEDPLTCIGRRRSVERCTPTRAEAMAAVDPVIAVEQRVIRSWGEVATYDAAAASCDRRRCALEVDGTYVLTDREHVTATFSRAQGPRLARFLAAALEAPPA